MIEFELPPSLPEPPAAPPPPDIDIPPEAFGARQIATLMPEALDDPIYRQETATANATRVEELNNDFIGRQRKILQTGPDAFYNRQGRDAILGAPEVIGRLNATIPTGPTIRRNAPPTSTSSTLNSVKGSAASSRPRPSSIARSPIG